MPTHTDSDHSYQHKWMVPARNFGYFELSVAPTTSLRANILTRKKNEPMLDCWRGKLTLESIKVQAVLTLSYGP